MLKRNNIIICARNPPRSTEEAYIKSCESFVQLTHEIKKYMTDYNHACYQ